MRHAAQPKSNSSRNRWSLDEFRAAKEPAGVVELLRRRHCWPAPRGQCRRIAKSCATAIAAQPQRASRWRNRPMPASRAPAAERTRADGQTAHGDDTQCQSAKGQQTDGDRANAEWRDRHAAEGEQSADSAFAHGNPGLDRRLQHGQTGRRCECGPAAARRNWRGCDIQMPAEGNLPACSSASIRGQIAWRFCAPATAKTNNEQPDKKSTMLE